MTLSRGSRLGGYEITTQIGEGGMGQVYRARDTKLDRDVAIKILPELFAHDADRLARFQREAKALASLNHPNIAQIFGIEDANGIRALVMELVDGDDLSALIANGQPKAESGSSRVRDNASAAPRGGGATRGLNIDDALAIAKQIADALEAAHEQGIVHRDLKPANIKVRPDGTVKVLDFGLAKAVDTAQGSGLRAQGELSNSPTLTSPAMTALGMILGTAAYMSPEQAKGRAVDKRADVWAFGAVLYEMLAGRRAFEGDDVTDTMARILMKDPDWTALPATVPPAVVNVLQRCLQKDRKQRLRDIGDVSLALDGAFETSAPGAVAHPSAPRSRAGLWGAISASGLVGALAAGAAVWSFAERAPTPVETARLSVMVPANRPIAMGWQPGRSIALSPDGTQLVYVATNLDAPEEQGGRRVQLELRSLATLAVRDLPGTTGARQPFFSPDGQWVGFFTTDGELKKISMAGGNPVTLVQKINGGSLAFGVWVRDNTIIYGTLTTGLRRVSAEGGAVTDLTTIDAARNEPFHLSPALTPSNRAVLFTATVWSGGRIDAVILDSGERRVVLENARAPLVLGSGHLLFHRDQAILIAPFDPDRLTVTGSAVPLIDDVRLDSQSTSFPVAQLAASVNGAIAYLPAVDTAGALGLVSRDGKFERIGQPPGYVSQPRVSADGHSIAFAAARGPVGEVYIYDRRRGSTTKLTDDGRDDGMAWHPDGRSLAVSSTRNGIRGIFLDHLDGREQLLVATPANVTITRNAGWSPDGRVLAYTVQTGLLHDIWVLTMGEKPSSEAFLKGVAAEHSPTFSPDGRWLAYVSDESGRSEVYVRPYPQGERLAVSTGGGTGPAWRRDGKELFFQSANDGAPSMMAVSVAAEGASLRLGTPVPLFALRLPGPSGAAEQYATSSNFGRSYDVLPDGRFVMMRRPDQSGAREIVLIQNFVEELTRLRR